MIPLSHATNESSFCQTATTTKCIATTLSIDMAPKPASTAGKAPVGSKALAKTTPTTEGEKKPALARSRCNIGVVLFIHLQGPQTGLFRFSNKSMAILNSFVGVNDINCTVTTTGRSLLVIRSL
jgi:hypothetical protein